MLFPKEGSLAVALGARTSQRSMFVSSPATAKQFVVVGCQAIFNGIKELGTVCTNFKLPSLFRALILVVLSFDTVAKKSPSTFHFKSEIGFRCSPDGPSITLWLISVASSTRVQCWASDVLQSAPSGPQIQEDTVQNAVPGQKRLQNFYSRHYYTTPRYLSLIATLLVKSMSMSYLEGKTHFGPCDGCSVAIFVRGRDAAVLLCHAGAFEW